MASSKINLDGLSVAELTTLISDAQAMRVSKMEDAKHAFLSEMTEKAAQIGLDISELLTTPAPRSKGNGRKPRKDAGKPVSAKYRGPQGEEWSGRGRRPLWVADALAGGKSLEDFAI